MTVLYMLILIAHYDTILKSVIYKYYCNQNINCYKKITKTSKIKNLTVKHVYSSRPCRAEWLYPMKRRKTNNGLWADN